MDFQMPEMIKNSYKSMANLFSHFSHALSNVKNAYEMCGETFLTLYTCIFKCQKWLKMHMKSMTKLFSHFTHAFSNVKNGQKCI